MALCDTCRRLDLHTILLQESSVCENDYYWDEQAGVLCFRHSNNILNVKLSASTGCQLCKIILTAFERKGAEVYEIASDLGIVLHEGQETIKASLTSPDEHLITICDFDLSFSNPLDIPVDFPFSPLRQTHHDLGSAACTALAASWLHSCVENHSCSTSHITDQRSDTRFLHVGDENRNPILVDFAPGNQPQQWVALSYCWGGEPSQQLRKGSSEDCLRRGIHVNDFDATIRDAILTTRALNIEYIWIDALCIYQENCSTDWSTQSSKMGYIYEKSTITLVPVDSASVKQGFLGPRNTEYVALTWRSEDHVIRSNQYGNLQQIFLSESWNLENDNLNGPWMERAWTLQEGLLPNRLLYYSSSQMAWKCCEQIIYERGTGSEPVVDVIRGFRDEGGQDFWSFDLFTKFKLWPWFINGPGVHVSHEKYRLWYELVQDYSLRRIKYTSERLIAISGLAAKYADIIEDYEYFAGLWKTDMIPGLLWRVPGAKAFSAIGSDQQSCGEYNAYPSWSWLSVAPGFVVRNDCARVQDFRILSTIEDVTVELVDPSNRFSKVKNGTVTLSGPMFQFSQLYNRDWKSQGTSLSAFERHLSQIIERDHCEGAERFSETGCFLAVLMLRHLVCFDNRMDVLILESKKTDTKSTSPTFKRIGQVKLVYLSQTLKASPALRLQLERSKNSIRHRLDPGSWRRGARLIYCREVFQEIKSKPWRRQTITIM